MCDWFRCSDLERPITLPAAARVCSAVVETPARSRLQNSPLASEVVIPRQRQTALLRKNPSISRVAPVLPK
jgi:hypothetical protein